MRRVFLCLVVWMVAAQGATAASLSEHLQPYLRVLSGETKQFTLSIDIKLTVDGRPQQAKLTLSRADAHSFFLVLEHEKYSVMLVRDAGRTVFALPVKGVQFVGQGALVGGDTLDPTTVLDRMMGEGTSVTTYYKLLRHANGFLAANALTRLAGLESEDGGTTWTSQRLANLKISFGEDHSITVEAAGTIVKATMVEKPGDLPAAGANLKTMPVKRDELERLLVRGARRTLEVAAPSSELTDPAHEGRAVAHGELRWQGDQRLVLLSGTPAEIGTAHGQLLKAEAERCRDSSLYMVGLGATVDRGAWFLDELREAYRRLEPHIPPDHKAEVDAIADAAGISREEGRLANVFPELFHCSGFALFGKATVDGKLYHGRVLDYMTMIGLQDTATTFIIAPAGKIAFANVGYAGFVGSVSGMNAQQISVGEMGGRGQGQWDGVPMSSLMRRALEECSTLDQVKQLWANNPRTCEYYYVFADGKGPDAVACSATPAKCEFLKPGEAHELLGTGIPDAVVLSAGSRLEELRKRVQEGYGRFDATSCMGLMCRPVAMTSNLHDVLFVPQDGVFYVANADHHAPAADRPYTRYDLNELLNGMPSGAEPAPAPGRAARWYQKTKHFFTGTSEGTLPP